MAWSCLWLEGPFAGMRRPDKSHYVISMMLDFVTLAPENGAEPQRAPCIEIWCDPRHPDAHKDEALRKWLSSKASNFMALVRYSNVDAFLLVAPEINGTGQRLEIAGERGEEHSTAEIFEACGGLPILPLNA